MSEITKEKDKVSREIIVKLNDAGYTVSLMVDGSIIVRMPLADYEIKVVRKNKRVF